jgi:5-methyltetrahydrofolate--homocysteine methyltransferase
MPSRFDIIINDVISGNNDSIIEHVKELINTGCRPQDILNQGMIAAMEKIGEKFKDGTVFIPEVLLSARAMNEAVLYLEPYLSSDQKTNKKRKVMIGTVYGDLHDIGKNLVITMLRGVGYEVIDLGINLKSDAFVEKVREIKPDVLGMSALLTTTMPEMKTVIKLLEKNGLRESIKILVGGAPVNQKYADEIGADAYAQDAGQAVSVINDLLK